MPAAWKSACALCAVGNRGEGRCQRSCSVTLPVQAQRDIGANNMLHSDRLGQRPSEVLCGGRCVLQARAMPLCRKHGVQGMRRAGVCVVGYAASRPLLAAASCLFDGKSLSRHNVQSTASMVPRFTCVLPAADDTSPAAPACPGAAHAAPSGPIPSPPLQGGKGALVRCYSVSLCYSLSSYPFTDTFSPSAGQQGCARGMILCVTELQRPELSSFSSSR